MCLRPNTSAMKPMKSNWIRAPQQISMCNLATWIFHLQGWIKSQKNQNCLAWISGNFKIVWQGELGELKTVCWFFKYCLLDLLNFFCCKLLDLTERWRHILSTFCSIIKLSINKDNPLVPSQSATPISVCQIGKSLKLSVRGEF